VDEDGMTSGDYLQGFMLGTRDALFEKGRKSITLTIEEVSAHSVGQLIALYERTVGYYAYLVGINAYHQPGVEAGKKAASSILKVRKKVVEWLANNPNHPISAEELAGVIDEANHKEWIFKILENLSVNSAGSITREESVCSLDDRFVQHS